MAAFSGTAGSVLLGGVVIPVSEWSFDISMPPVEITAFENVWDAIIPSVRTATGSISGQATDGGGGGQNVGRNRMLAVADYCSLTLYEDGSRFWTIGSALVTGMTTGVSAKGKGEISFNFQAKGLITYT